MHPGCPHIFTVISDRLYVNDRTGKGQWRDVENGNTVALNQMAEHLHELTVFDKDGKLIKSIILTACERDRIPRRRNKNEAEVIETTGQRDRSIP